MPVTSRDANVPSHPKAYAALHSLLITNSAEGLSIRHPREEDFHSPYQLRTVYKESTFEMILLCTR